MNRYLPLLAALFLVPAVFFPAARASTPVNINTADAPTLAQSLDGVGLAKANAIVAWREANGPFDSADQLSEVKGIGPSLVDRNREAIQVDAGKAVKKEKVAATKTAPGRARTPKAKAEATAD